MLKSLNFLKLTNIYKQTLLNSATARILPVQNNTTYSHTTQDLKNKSFISIHHASFTFSAIKQAKKKRISDINFIYTNENDNHLFIQTQLNKSLLLFFSLIHLPFYLVALNLGLNLNLLEMDMIRLGIKSIAISQAVISGINISSIISCVDMKFERIKQIKNFEFESEELRQEISTSDGSIYIAFIPLMMNFIVAQIFMNFHHISNGILTICSVGFLSSNFINLIILGVYVLKRNNLNVKNSSLFRINLVFAILNVVCYFFILNYMSGCEYKKKNPFLYCNDCNRIENLKTINEYVKEDTKKIEIEISELMEDITPEQMELMEKIFKDDD